MILSVHKSSPQHASPPTHTKRILLASVYQYPYPPLRVIIRILTPISYTQNFVHPTPSLPPPKKNIHCPRTEPKYESQLWSLQSLGLPTAKSAASALELTGEIPRTLWRNERLITNAIYSKVTQILQKYAYIE